MVASFPLFIPKSFDRIIYKLISLLSQYKIRQSSHNKTQFYNTFLIISYLERWEEIYTKQFLQKLFETVFTAIKENSFVYSGIYYVVCTCFCNTFKSHLSDNFLLEYLVQFNKGFVCEHTRNSHNFKSHCDNLKLIKR